MTMMQDDHDSNMMQETSETDMGLSAAATTIRCAISHSSIGVVATRNEIYATGWR
jgi:hypothetical protein